MRWPIAPSEAWERIYLAMSRDRFFYHLDYNMRCPDGHRWYMPRRRRGLFCNYPHGEQRKSCRQPLREIRQHIINDGNGPDKRKRSPAAVA